MKRGATFTICLLMLIFFAGSAICTAQEEVQPESVRIIKGVRFSVYPGALGAAKYSRVNVDLANGILHTPTGEVKWHDLTINGVSQVGLIKNKLGRLVVVAIWPNLNMVFMECSGGTITSIRKICRGRPMKRPPPQ
jgi:hypothetical protein